MFFHLEAGFGFLWFFCMIPLIAKDLALVWFGNLKGFTGIDLGLGYHLQFLMGIEVTSWLFGTTYGVVCRGKL